MVWARVDSNQRSRYPILNLDSPNLALVRRSESYLPSQRCHAKPGLSTRNCTSRLCVTSVTYTVRPSGPPKQRLLGDLPSTSISCCTLPSGDSFTTVPLP